MTRFRLLSPDDLEDLPDPEWLIRGVLPAGGLAILYGEPGAGKSFLALDWANRVAAGEGWLGREVKAGEVIYVYAEGAAGLKRREAAWRKSNGGNVDRLRFLPHSVNLLDREEVALLIAAIGRQGRSPSLIIIDTLARSFGDGDENSAKDMNGFVGGADKLREAFPGSTVLVIHHSGKDPKKGGRGSSALLAAADTMMSLSKNASALTLKCDKQKDAQIFNDQRLELRSVSVGDGHASCIIAPRSVSLDPDQANDNQPSASADPRARNNDNIALAALASSGQTGAAFSQWQVASTLAPSTFKDARARLLKSGQVEKTGSLYRTAGRGPKAETRTARGQKSAA